MNSSIFYERFLDQQFILIHQLDAFVFRDELDYWCSAGYDYIGAPWLEGFIDDAKGRFLQIAGNGGFSLRNAESHLRVLRSKKRSRIESGKELRERFFNSRRMRRVKIAPSLILKALGVGNNTAWLKNNSNEDWFWAMAAHKIDAGFISAEFKDAIGFAFESQPKRLFLLNNERLPFGCHAWAKRSNIDFWKPIFKEYGYSI
jgi:hypothetical protein